MEYLTLQRRAAFVELRKDVLCFTLSGRGGIQAQRKESKRGTRETPGTRQPDMEGAGKQGIQNEIKVKGR